MLKRRVRKYEEGGLNLNPGHFAQLIAAMSLVQIIFQFYFYPNIGCVGSRLLSII
jgi:hypothetical protein